MELGMFIRSIKEAGLVKVALPDVLRLLFECAEYELQECRGSERNDILSESTFRKWIAGARKCNAIKYFKKGKLNNPDAVYNFFKNRPQNKLEELQKKFRDKKDVNDCVDCETKDMDIFCWSLVNQFSDILGLERVAMPVSDIPSNSEISSDAVENKNRENVVDEKKSITCENAIVHQEGVGKSEIFIPDDCRICLCCKKWDGNVQAACRNPDDESGKCKALNKEVRALEGNGCVKFKENYGAITSYDLFKKKFRILEFYDKL